MHNTEWLNNISNQASEKQIIKDPHSCVVNGRKFAYATDGYMLAAVAIDDEKTCLDNMEHDLVDHFLRIGRSGKTAFFHDVKEWVGDDTLTLCEECGGKGCGGEGTVINRHPQCNGYGWKGDYKRYGIILDTAINRCLIAKPFHHLSADYINVMKDKKTDSICFIANDFRIIVSPMVGRCDATDRFSAWLEESDVL